MRALHYKKQNQAQAAARPTTKLLSLDELPHIEEDEHLAGRQPWNRAQTVSRTTEGAAKRRRHTTLSKSSKKAVKLNTERVVHVGSDDGADSASAGSEDDRADWNAEADEDVEPDPAAYTTADGDDYDDAGECFLCNTPHIFRIS